MWFGLKDISLTLSYLKKHDGSPPKPGKYSPAQKLMHLGVTALVGLTIITGLNHDGEKLTRLSGSAISTCSKMEAGA